MLQQEMQLRSALMPILRRIAVFHYLAWTLKGIMTGTAAALFVLVAARVFPLLNSKNWALAFAGLIVGLAAVRSWTLRPGIWQAAMAADNAGLKERAATAWQFRSLEDRLAQCQREDALQHLTRFDLRRLGGAMPWRETWITLILLILAVAAALWPNPLEAETLARKQAEAALAAARQEVAKSLEQLQQDNKLNPEAKQAVQKQLEQLQKELAKTESLEEGKLAVSKSGQEIEKILSREDQSEILEHMAEMLQQDPLTKGAGEALAKGDKQEFQKQLDGLAAKINSLSKEEQQKLSGQLQEIALSVRSKNDDQLADSLDKSAAALAKGEGHGAGELGDVKAQISASLDSSQASAVLSQSLQQALGRAQQEIQAAADQAAPGEKGQGSSSSGQNGGKGQNGSSGNGQSGSGSNNSSGSNGSGGSGAGGGAGAGKLGGPAGDGSTNQQGMQGGPGSNSMGRGSGSAPAREGQYEQIYAPTRAGGSSQQSQINGTQGSGGDSTKIDADTGLLTSGGLLPYNQVFSEYEAEARESVERQYTPDNMKDLVRNYFLSLSGE
ncbi:MAG: hypothetical protein ACYC2T_08970 [Bacillota bacterium]